MYTACKHYLFFLFTSGPSGGCDGGGHGYDNLKADQMRVGPVSDIERTLILIN